MVNDSQQIKKLREEIRSIIQEVGIGIGERLEKKKLLQIIKGVETVFHGKEITPEEAKAILLSKGETEDSIIKGLQWLAIHG